MATCSHGRDLNTQVCKYCSCPHGKDTSTCQACQAVVAAAMTGPPASTKQTGQCVHGIEMNRICGKCMASGALGMSGSFVARMPDYFAMDPAEKARLEYDKRLKDMEKVPGAMRMFRTWSLDEANNLSAMVASYRWRKGENVSTPMHHPGHTGFFGFASLAQLRKQEKQWWELSQTGKAYGDERVVSVMDFSIPRKRWYVSGTFLGYGHMVIAEHGGRSHFAIPEYIIEPDGSDPDWGLRILTVADKYGMTLVSVETARELQTGLVPYYRGKPIT